MGNLLDRLRTFQVEPAVSRRQAQKLWGDLHWPGQLEQFHTLLRRELAACEKNHIPKQEHDIVLRYLELIPSEYALYLEDPLRVPQGGWTMEPLMKEARDYVSLRATYARGNEGAGLSRQRAVWDNNRKLMSTPLGGLTLSPGVRGQGGSRGAGVCNTCGGHDHKQNACYNHIAKSDPKWAKKSAEARKKQCITCSGFAHYFVLFK